MIFISGYDIYVITDHVPSNVHALERTMEKPEVVQQENIILFTENIYWSKKLGNFKLCKL